MEEAEILSIWKTYYLKLEENLIVSRKNASDITKIKVQSIIGSMKPVKIYIVVAGILWIGFLDVLIINLFQIASPFFLTSAIILVILNKIAIGIYLYQTIIIHGVDISEPVVATQEKIASLISSTIWIARLLFLQLPLWTTFYLTLSELKNQNNILLVVQSLVTIAFTFISIWLFFNIKYANRNKKWFQLIFAGKEWTPLIKSLDLLNQTKEND